ncbi:hypothetical protein RRG08_022896 [Elysia crispata]|uniref:Uncharacterized protein n=1 Tax=Elysia crispata TaxID=231223 RepID=A0AAE0XNS7_9GAST|nr:hypothetical protein RRG08_022896 [Elysia crispata]
MRLSFRKFSPTKDWSTLIVTRGTRLSPVTEEITVGIECTVRFKPPGGQMMSLESHLFSHVCLTGAIYDGHEDVVEFSPPGLLGKSERTLLYHRSRLMRMTSRLLVLE